MDNKQYNTKGNGDENMNKSENIYPSLDFGLILGKGTRISSQEALEGVKPIDWSKEILMGNFKEKTIIKSKEGEDK